MKNTTDFFSDPFQALSALGWGLVAWGLLGLIGGLTGCRPGEQAASGAISTQRAAVAMMGQQPPDSTRWRLLYTLDPYDGGQKIARDSSSTRFLVLAKDGTYHLHQPQHTQVGRSQVGRWYLNRAQDALAFLPNGEQAKSSAPDDPQAYRHRIFKQTEDTLVLGWQGRHGFVEEWYLRVSPNDSLLVPPIP